MAGARGLMQVRPDRTQSRRASEEPVRSGHLRADRCGHLMKVRVRA
ncbi:MULTISPECIES: hypothetical protein [Burkholderia]|nr:hypothetical protein [Burkholderia cepacia]MDN7617033.1 hypothetical protein [Burkholderia cepacia]MDN7890923.1 hypothetical protein [Burkholderia cepacia]